LLADQPFEGSDPRFVLLKKVGRGSVLIEGAGLVSFDPDTDQIAREIVALLQTVERFASQKLLRDLALKFDAVRAIPDHELSSFESPACRSNVKSAHVRPQGPTPCLRQLSVEINIHNDTNDYVNRSPLASRPFGQRNWITSYT
jgi:hypothetical protein